MTPETDQLGTAADTPDTPEVSLRLPGMRVAYDGDGFDESVLAPTWTEQLQSWLDRAVSAGVSEPNAMVLATADTNGRPSSRTVLCKGLDERGLVFYTNYTSTKSHDLSASRYASATFPWYLLQRQVHVSGEVEKLSAAETAEYWASRPRGSQLGAWASPQSRVVGDRRALDNALHSIERRFAGVEQIPPPPHWGGWLIRPELVEFWQGRQDRLHDRLRFVLTHDGWRVERLAP